jgi:pimeloyl-ACP methyl ester carboxylesterase
MLDVGLLVAGGSAYASFLRAGRGKSILLLHGFASDASDDWVQTGWFDALVAAGFDVIAPDLRGHRQSAKSRDPADYRLDAFTGDVAALCDYCWESFGSALSAIRWGRTSRCPWRSPQPIALRASSWAAWAIGSPRPWG